MLARILGQAQGRRQTSKQDEASFERWRRGPQGGSGGSPPPPPPPPPPPNPPPQGVFFFFFEKSTSGQNLPHASYGPEAGCVYRLLRRRTLTSA